MGHIIWKLSALATVVGMGLTGVVYQQGGFGKTGAKGAAPTAAVGAKGAPQPNVPGAKAPAGKTPPPPASDPFAAADGQSDPGRDAVPPQLDATTDSLPAEFADSGAAPPNLGASASAEPDLMEGSADRGQQPNPLTEEDSFAQNSRAKTAARTDPRTSPGRPAASGARPSMNEPDEDVRSSHRAAGANSFDPGDATVDQRPPVVGKSQKRTRPKMIEDGDPPAAGQIVDQIVADPQYGPPNPFQNDATSSPPGVAGKKRPQINDDDAFVQGGAAPGPEPAVPAKRQGPRPRVQDFSSDGPGNAALPGSQQPDGAQPIPKIDRDAIATDREMPPVAQTGRKRPNSLVDDGDDIAAPQSGAVGASNANSDSFETGSRGREPEAQMTDSAISAPTQRRPSRHVLEIESNDSSSGAFPPQSEAAASRTAETKVIAVPKRLASNTAFPGTPTGTGRPRVTIEKRAPATAYIGQPLIYHIVIRNVGNGIAQQVVVEDIVPDGVAMQGSIPQAELVAKKLTWKIGSLAAGEERKISVKVIPGAEGAVGSAATVNFLADPATYASTAEPDPVVPATPVGSPAAGPVQLTNGVPPAPRESRVTLEIKGPKQVGVGQPYEVRFRLTNRTNQPVEGVMIRKMLPATLRHQTGDQDLVYKVGTLAPAESRDVTMTLTAVQPGRAVSRVMVLGTDGQTLQTQEFSVDAGAVGNQSNSADLPVTLERMGNIRPPVNRTTAYANRLTNRGPQAVSRLRVTETIPQGMDFVSAGDEGQYDATTRQVVWNVARLESKASTDLEIALVAKVKHPEANSVVVADPVGNQVQTTAQISAGGAPVLSVEVVPPRGPVQVGDPVVYEIRLANKGTEVVQQAAVRLSIPEELKLTKAGPLNFQQQGIDIIFDAIPALEPGRQALLTAEFIAQAPGASRLKVQFVGAHMTNPVSREENLKIAAR